jgi:hypothetical protein
MSAQRRPTSRKPIVGTTKDTHDATPEQGSRPATEEEVAEALRHFGKTQYEEHEEHEEATRRPAARSATMARKETLCQKADNEDEEAPGLTEAEFYEKLKDPKTLYQEIAELIQQAKDLRAIGENYREQMVEAKQALRDSIATGTPAPHEGARRTTKLPDPPLFDGTSKDGVTFDNWLIQVKNKLRGNADAYPTEDLKIIYAASRTSGDALALISPRLSAANRHAYETLDELYEHLEELYGDPNKERNARQAFKDLTMKKGQTFQEFYAIFLRHVADGNISPRDLKDELNDKLSWKLQEVVAMYYNDPAVTLSQFARHCTTNDQQIRTRLEKRDRTARKPEDTRKAMPEQAPTRQTSKTTEGEKAPQPTRGQPAAATELKCYNCFEPGHIARNCPKPKTEKTKQILAAKLAEVSARTQPDQEAENEVP